MRVAQSVSELIGKTPIVKLNRIVESDSADIYLKLEFMNPGSSVKDRIALAMIEDAEKKGLLKEGDTIIEPTSGELVLTPGPEGMGGAIRKATELAKENGYFIPQQFKNQSNPEIHRLTTGPEIVEQMGDQLDAFIAGIGTGGTITGAGEVLKEAYKDIKIYAVEPADSPVLSGGKPGPHKIQGIGAGFIPETLDVEVYDEIVQVKTEQAFEYARRVAKEEGILVGISSGAVIYAATEIAKKLGKGKKVLVIIPSNGERYLSTPLYQFES